MAPIKSVDNINMYVAQKRLCVLWFVLSFFMILLFVLFTVTNKFGTQTSDAWQWILQQILPVLTLITGVFVNTSRQSTGIKNIRKFYYRLCMLLSSGYFFFLIITILAIPFAYQYASKSGYDFLKTSSLYLLPLLAIVTASLGIFFTKG
jgi:hypothetical protein